MSHDATPVYLPGEYCEVCGGTTRLGTMTYPGDVKFTVCGLCHENEPKLKPPAC